MRHAFKVAVVLAVAAFVWPEPAFSERPGFQRIDINPVCRTTCQVVCEVGCGRLVTPPPPRE